MKRAQRIDGEAFAAFIIPLQGHQPASAVLSFYSTLNISPLCERTLVHRGFCVIPGRRLRGNNVLSVMVCSTVHGRAGSCDEGANCATL